jgi:hypothetical protein
VTVDLAKAAAQLRAEAGAEFQSFASSLGWSTLPVDVWVDGQARVNRIAITLPMPSGSGMPAGFRVAEVADFYDFGVQVQVSAPPASEVISASEFSQSMSNSGSSSFNSIGSQPSPPQVTGTMSAAQGRAAEQAILAFWTALSTNSAKAVEQAVVPSQRSCVAGFLQGSGVQFKVSALRITAATPAGTGKATVWFSVNATMQIGGHTIPMSQPGASSTSWLLATEIGSVWYADVSGGSWALPPC